MSYDVVPGLGIACKTVEGQTIVVGNIRYMDSVEVNYGTRGNETAHRLEQQGKTVVFVAVDGEAIGVIAVSDRPRPEAGSTVAALNRMGIQVRQNHKNGEMSYCTVSCCYR